MKAELGTTTYETTGSSVTADMTTREVMNELYRALAIAQANIFMQLRERSDDKELRDYAAEVIVKLQMFEPVTFVKQCGTGTVWNPITQQCE